MKKLVMFAVMLFVSSPLWAGTVETSGTVVPNHTDPHTHTVEVSDQQDQDQPFGYGVGLDTVVYSGTNPLLEEVRVDTRYDIENQETRVFLVAKVDIFSYLKNR